MNISDLKAKYDEIKILVDKIKKKTSLLDLSNVVFNNYFDKKLYAVRINGAFFDAYNSIEVYDNKIGRFFLEEEIENDYNQVRKYTLDAIVIMMLPSNALTMDDVEFIHKLGYRIKKENNILIYRYSYGKGRRIPTNLEFNILYDNLEFIYSLIKNEFNTIVDAENVNAHIESFIDTKNLEYLANYEYKLNYQYPFKELPVNQAIVDEFKDYTYIGETFLFSTFYPVVVKENRVRPLVLTFIHEGYDISTRYILTSIDTYNEIIFGILDDVFSHAKRLPEKMLLDNQLLYSLIKNTLEAMNIEVELVAPSTQVLTKRMLTNDSDIAHPGSFDLTADIQKKEDIETFLNYIVSNVKNINVEGLSELYEELKNSELIEDEDDTNLDEIFLDDDNDDSNDGFVS